MSLHLLLLDYPKKTKPEKHKNPQTNKQTPTKPKKKWCWRNSIHKLLNTAEDTAIEHKKCKVTVFRDREKERKSSYICAMEERKFVFHQKFRLFHVIIHFMSTIDLTNVGWVKALMEAARKRVRFSLECTQRGCILTRIKQQECIISCVLFHSQVRNHITTLSWNPQPSLPEGGQHTGWKNPAVEGAEEGHKWLQIHEGSRNEETYKSSHLCHDVIFFLFAVSLRTPKYFF